MDKGETQTNEPEEKKVDDYEITQTDCMCQEKMR